MRDLIQKRLKEMEETNPSLTNHPQNVMTYLVGRTKLFFRRTKQIPQAEHIYSTDKEENERICTVLRVRNWARSNGRNLVYQMGPARSVFDGNPSIITEEEGEQWSKNFQEKLNYQKDLKTKPDAYQEYAEIGTLYD